MVRVQGTEGARSEQGSGGQEARARCPLADQFPGLQSREGCGRDESRTDNLYKFKFNLIFSFLHF